MRFVLILLLGTLARPLRSQTLPARGAADARNSAAAQARQQRQDSLQRLFDRAPPYVQVAYYRNTRQLPWSARLTFYLWQPPHWVVLPAVTDHTFLLPPLSGDSVRVGLQEAGHPLIPVTLHTRGLVHGAQLTFGSIDRAHLTEQVRATADWEPLGEVLKSINLAAWRHAKGVSGLRYVIFIPRVYGDGMVFIITRPVFQRKQLKLPSKKG